MWACLTSFQIILCLQLLEHGMEILKEKGEGRQREEERKCGEKVKGVGGGRKTGREKNREQLNKILCTSLSAFYL